MADATDRTRLQQSPAGRSARRSIAWKGSSWMGSSTGFFDYSITCEIGNGGKRHLVIGAGKSHKFTIPEDEVPH